MYPIVRDKNPHAAITTLDQIIDDKEGFGALITFRNSVFHIERSEARVEQRDEGSLRTLRSTEFRSELTAGAERFLKAIRLGAVDRVAVE